MQKKLKILEFLLLSILFIFYGCGMLSLPSATDSGLNKAGQIPAAGDDVTGETYDTDDTNETDNTEPEDLENENDDEEDIEEGWWNGINHMHRAYSLTRQYTFPKDEGIIDVFNIHKLLFEINHNYEQAVQSSEELLEPVFIEPLFDFGDDEMADPANGYTDISDHHALATEEGTSYFLLNWIWNELPEQISYAATNGNFNNESGGIELNFAYLVDYNDDDLYCIRTYLSGNRNSGYYQIKTSQAATKDGAYGTSIIGAGYFTDEEEDGYYLLKIIDNEALRDYPEGRYFKFPAYSKQNVFKKYEPILGNALEEIDDPLNFGEIIEEMDFYSYTGTDHPLSVDDFRNDEMILNY